MVRWLAAAMVLIVSVGGSTPPVAASIDSAPTVQAIVDSPDYNSASHAEVLRLYQAIFGRYPDLEGAKYWIRVNDGLEDGTPHNVLAIAGFMSGSTEWRTAYDGTSDALFLQMVYSNVLGRDYDEAGYNYWLDLLRGTDAHGDNPAKSQLDRHELVFYVTANPEFVDAYPFQPVAVSPVSPVEAIQLLADAPSFRIEMRSWSDSASADPAAEIWERSSSHELERYAWDFRELVDPWLSSQMLSDDVDNLLPLIVDDEPTDAGSHLLFAALRAVSWSYEGECRTSDEATVRKTLDHTAPQTLVAIVRQMPQSELWAGEVVGEGITGADIGPGWDPSRTWVKASVYDLQPCLSSADILSSLETVIARTSAETVEAGYDDDGRLVRLSFVQNTRRLLPAEYSPVNHEVIVSYNVDPATLAFPIETDVHP